jgi:ribose transport system substrate-binding protein
VSKKRGILFTAVLVIFCICSLMLTHSINAAQDTKPAREVSVICRSADTEEWSTIKLGIDQAAKDLGVDANFITLTGRNNTNEQIFLLNREAKGGASAVVMMPVSSPELTEPVHNALKNIPIVAMQSKVSGIKDMQIVACDNVGMGISLAQEIVREERHPAVPAVILRSSVNSSNETDFQKGLQKGLRGRNLFYCDIPSNHAEAAAAVRNCFLGHADAFFVALNAETLGLAAQVKETGNFKIHLYGAGRTNQIVSMLEQKVIGAIAVENDYHMGYLGLKAAVDQMDHKKHSSIKINSRIVNSSDMYQPQNERLLFPFV